jgi:hypothetical protein
MSNDTKPTMTQPEYHAWKKTFIADRGREPTPYEAWVAGTAHGASRGEMPHDDFEKLKAYYGEPIFHMPSKSVRRP